MKQWPTTEAVKRLGLKHPKYRPGWVVRDGAVVHVACKPRWVFEHGDALFEAVDVPSLMLVPTGHDQLAQLARCAWLGTVQHLSLVLKTGAPLADLLASPHLGALRSLDLSWSSNDPAYLPHDLPRKTLGPLLDSPVFSQLSSFRTSVASVKLLLEVVEASRNLRHLGLRMQGGFAGKEIDRVGASMDLPVLETLSISTGVAPVNAPALRSMRCGGGGIPAGAQLDRLEHLRLDHVFMDALPGSLEQVAPTLRKLEVGCGRADLASECWRALSKAGLVTLDALDVWNAPCDSASLEQVAASGLLGRLRDLSLTLCAPDALALVGGELEGLGALKVMWEGGGPLAMPAVPALQKLKLGHWRVESGDEDLSALIAEPPPQLEHLACVVAQNKPSVTDAGLQALIEGAPGALEHLYLRLDKLPKKLGTALHERFTVWDAGLKLTGPFVALNDWTWPYLPWGPAPWAIDED